MLVKSKRGAATHHKIVRWLLATNNKLQDDQPGACDERTSIRSQQQRVALEISGGAEGGVVNHNNKKLFDEGDCVESTTYKSACFDHAANVPIAPESTYSSG
jgi:hypothetical protein